MEPGVVPCPGCGEPIVETRTRGIGNPLGWVRWHPERPGVVQLQCPACQRVFDWERKKLVIYERAESSAMLSASE